MRRSALLLVGLVAGCTGATERDPSQWPIARAEIERAIPTDDPAEAMYRQHCLPCHGVDGRGAGGVTGADFTSPEGPLRRPDAELLVSIRDGRRGEIGIMPAQGALIGEEGSAAVLAYVRRRFGPDIGPDIVPELVPAGVPDAVPADTVPEIVPAAASADALVE